MMATPETGLLGVVILLVLLMTGMPIGAALGLVVALTPADRPTHGIVVAAPGGAGIDAAAIANVHFMMGK
jgi:hypothetical protein